jgi:hypothetical protein
MTPPRWSIRPFIWTLSGWSLAAGLAVVCVCQYTHIAMLENDAAENQNYREDCRNLLKPLKTKNLPPS